MAAIGVATMRTPGALAKRPLGAKAVAAAFFAAGLLLGETVFAADPPSDSSPHSAREDVQVVAERLVSALDDDRAHARQAAFVELTRLAEEPSAAPVVRTAIHTAFETADASFEARRSLQRLVELFPADAQTVQRAATETPPPSEAEIDEWLTQATSDDYGLRLASEAKLKSLLDDPAAAGVLLTVVKRRLGDPKVGSAVRGELTDLWKRTRAAWMVTDPSKWRLPEVSDDQIDRWLDQLQATAQEAPGWKAAVARDQAERELTDLLLRDEYAPKLVAKIRERIDGKNLAAEAVTRLETLYDWSRPALVAEIWMLAGPEGELALPRPTAFPPHDGEKAKRYQSTMQFLLVGVPWKNPGDPSGKSSHFDYCDDERVHCADGYTLEPGNYPVGVAFPHPLNPTTFFFHIQNLSTPRRRMLFELSLENGYDTEADQARRLKEISQRTCDGFLSGKRELTRELVQMLATLDPATVSRFAVAYLSQRPAPEDNIVQREIDAALCQILGAYGTPEVLPGIVAAIDAGRLRPASDDQPFHRGWLAALAIVERTEWPGKDEWLASVVERTDRLLSDQTPDVGATAAAMLVGRHETNPEKFRLTNPQLDPLQLTELNRINSKLKCWSIAGVDERRQVIGWWAGQRNSLEAKRRKESPDPVR